MLNSTARMGDAVNAKPPDALSDWRLLELSRLLTVLAAVPLPDMSATVIEEPRQTDLFAH